MKIKIGASAGLIALAIVVLGITPVRADDPETLLDNLGYPEGPIWLGGEVYFAEMWSDRVSVWDGKKRRTFWQRSNCGPTAIAPFGENSLAILCHISNEIAIVGSDGEGGPLYSLRNLGPDIFNPNDVVSDGQGGIYLTASGHFDLTAPRQGHVVHLKEGGELRVVASDIHYANGITMHPDGNYLLVSEHLGLRVLGFPILEDGQLDELEVYADISYLDIDSPIFYEKWGPDGLEFDRDGNLYVAIYGKGIVLGIDQDARGIDMITTDLQLLTNVTFDPTAEHLYLTGSRYSRLGAGHGALMVREK